LETTKQFTGTESRERRRSLDGTDRRSRERRPFDGVDRRSRERRAFDRSLRRVQEKRSTAAPAKREPSAIDNLCAGHPSLSAFIENQIVLGRSPRDISEGIGVRLGLRVSAAAVATYRNNLAWTETGTVERTFDESRHVIDRLIDEMETDGSVSPGRIGSIAAMWRGIRRWVLGIVNSE